MPGRTPPPSRRIADELGSEIRSGRLPSGARLPSERELAEQHKVARNTVRQAFALLRAEGLVVAEHGRGVFVRPRPPRRRLAHDRYAQRHVEVHTGPFETESAEHGQAVTLGVTREPAPDGVARRLGVDPGTSVLCRRTRYDVDDLPMHLHTTCVRLELAAGTHLEDQELTTGSVYLELEALGHRIGRLHEDVEARMPSPEEIEALSIPPGVPILEIFHTTSDVDDLPVEVTHWMLPADRNVLGFDLPTC